MHNPFVIEVLRELRRITGEAERIMPLPLSAYNSCIYGACLAEGVGQQGWSGHSPRSGFATALFLKDGVKTLPTIREVCRWQSEKTLKIYLDVVGATASVHARELETQHGAKADKAALIFPALLLKTLRSL